MVHLAIVLITLFSWLPSGIQPSAADSYGISQAPPDVSGMLSEGPSTGTTSDTQPDDDDVGTPLDTMPPN